MKQNFADCLKQFKERGKVITVEGSLVTVDGLPSVFSGELVVFENKALGIVNGLDEDRVKILILKGNVPQMETKAARTKEALKVRVYDGILGNLLDGLGNMRLTSQNGPPDTEVWMDVFGNLMPIDKRRNVVVPLETGVAIVDMMVPLGKGQRELIIGDRKTGKTEFVRQTMLSHMLGGGICVYGGIARKAADTAALMNYFREKGVLGKICIVASSPTDTTGHSYYTPYTAMAIAEYFRDKGEDALVVLDDLTIHAKYCRELALLAKLPPGRDAYPGDIFYSHSRLMERAGAFEKGSITCLPIADTVLGDLSSYIQTNLMSMTDGHLFFDHELYNQGKRPPVNVFVSVSRVGRQTQTPLLRSFSQELIRFLAHHQRLQKVQHFGGELTGDVRRVLTLGKQLEAFFEQNEDEVVPTAVAVVCLASIWAGMWEGFDLYKMRQRVREIVKLYYADANVNQQFINMIKSFTDFTQLIDKVKTMPDIIIGRA